MVRKCCLHRNWKNFQFTIHFSCIWIWALRTANTNSFEYFLEADRQKRKSTRPTYIGSSCEKLQKETNKNVVILMHEQIFRLRSCIFNFLSIWICASLFASSLCTFHGYNLYCVYLCTHLIEGWRDKQFLSRHWLIFKWTAWKSHADDKSKWLLPFNSVLPFKRINFASNSRTLLNR